MLASIKNDVLQNTLGSGRRGRAVKVTADGLKNINNTYFPPPQKYIWISIKTELGECSVNECTVHAKNITFPTTTWYFGEHKPSF